MVDCGIIAKGESGSKRIELECEHKNGLLYVVPAEANWVCSDALLHVHALGGFFSEVVQLNVPQVRDAMQRWGLYYREKPVASIDQ